MVTTFLKIILSLPRKTKKSIVFATDIIWCVVACWTSFYLRLGYLVGLSEPLLLTIVIAIGLFIPLFHFFGLYQTIYRHIGWQTMIRIVQAFTVYGAIYCLIFLVVSIQGVPRTIGLIQPITFFILIVALRFLAQHLLNREYKPLSREQTLPRALIYGAGSVGKKMETALK